MTIELPRSQYEKLWRHIDALSPRGPTSEEMIGAFMPYGPERVHLGMEVAIGEIIFAPGEYKLGRGA